jgi:Putative Flp pilus-assembly TadE/G-like
MRRFDLRDERGVAMVLFAVMLPLMLMLTAIAWDAGNWWIHRKHLQTKVDAAALAAGGVWGFPCTLTSDTNIIGEARKYVGEHIEANGAPYTATTFNPQVGDTPYTKIHVVLNGSTWYDDDQGLNPADKSGQPNPGGTICDSSFLDVKATEQNNQPLFGWLPLAPDIKRKARIEIQEAEPEDLLPIAVRVPKPQSAAAVFYDESSGPTNGQIQAVKYFHEQCTTTNLTCDSSIPAGLGQWTTFDAATGNWAQFNPGPNMGVVIATSFRPACNTTTPPIPAGVVVATGPGPCLEDAGWVGQQVNAFCRQSSSGTAPVKCEDANGAGASQSVVSGLQFIRNYQSGGPVGTNPPELRTAYFDSASANCGALVRQSYFNSGTAAGCTALLHVTLDIGSQIAPPPPPGGTETRTAANTEVRYSMVDDLGNVTCSNFGNACDMAKSGGPNNLSATATIPFPAKSGRNSIVIRVRLKQTNVAGIPGGCGNSFGTTCQWFFTAQGRSGNTPTTAQILANPIQRAFMGDINKSGAVNWLRLQADCNNNGVADYGIPETSQAASVSSTGPAPCTSTPRYIVDMGLQGGLAKDQDEPPIQINIGATSLSAILDCDPNIPNLKDEIAQGCGNPPITYARNQFDTSPLCPPDPPGSFFNTPKPAPFDPPDNYPPWRCVLTQTSNAANQIEQGLNQRFFGVSNNPSCPADDPTRFVSGRNYWHNANNGTSTGAAGSANDGSNADKYTFADNGVPYGTTDLNPNDNLTNRLGEGGHDPRLVTLFFTTYDSFTGNGNEIFPVVGFGNFYITGYGRVNGSGNFQGGAPEDPCTTGNANTSPGAGNKTPPDIDLSGNGVIAWGHFVKEVTPKGRATGVLCKPSDFQPCVATLVE